MTNEIPRHARVVIVGEDDGARVMEL